MVRVKRRYLTVQFVPKEGKSTQIDATDRDVYHLLKDTVHMIHGDFGLGSILKSIQVKKFTPETGIALIAVQRGQHELLASSIPFIKKIKQTDCSVRMMYLSGTMRSSIKFIIKYYNNQSHAYEKHLSEMRRLKSEAKTLGGE